MRQPRTNHAVVSFHGNWTLTEKPNTNREVWYDHLSYLPQCSSRVEYYLIVLDGDDCARFSLIVKQEEQLEVNVLAHVNSSSRVVLTYRSGSVKRKQERQDCMTLGSLETRAERVT